VDGCIIDLARDEFASRRMAALDEWMNRMNWMGKGVERENIEQRKLDIQHRMQNRYKHIAGQLFDGGLPFLAIGL